IVFEAMANSLSIPVFRLQSFGDIRFGRLSALEGWPPGTAGCILSAEPEPLWRPYAEPVHSQRRPPRGAAQRQFKARRNSGDLDPNRGLGRRSTSGSADRPARDSTIGASTIGEQTGSLHRTVSA